MNGAPQTSIMLFSCSCWVGKLLMCFNLRMTSVHWSERDRECDGGEKRDFSVCYSWMIFNSLNVRVKKSRLEHMQCQDLFISFHAVPSQKDRTGGEGRDVGERYKQAIIQLQQQTKHNQTSLFRCVYVCLHVR